MDYQIKCEKCGEGLFTLSLTRFAKLYFARCNNETCDGLMLIGGHNLMKSTIDDNRLQRRSILFRRFT